MIPHCLPPPDPALWLDVARHSAARVWARTSRHLVDVGMSPLETPDAGGPEARSSVPEPPDAGGLEGGAGAGFPSLGHAFRFAWAVAWLSSFEEGRQGLRALLQQLMVPTDATLALERRLQWRDEHRGGDSAESLGAWLQSDVALDLPVLIAAPPEVLRLSRANFLRGGDLPGCILCALVGRRALTNLIAALPGST
eukprot:13608526-Alexandrium_andersonii.AAC.1